MKAIVSLGANLGARRATLEKALSALDRLPRTCVERVSSYYESEPVGVSGEQPPYINCVAQLETAMPPAVLLGCMLGIETAEGRARPTRADGTLILEKAPRVLDLDLLLFGEDDRHLHSEDPWMVLPHPRMLERAFVLIPLKELFPCGITLGFSFEKALGEVRDQKMALYSGF